MNLAHVLTPWTAAAGANVPQLLQDHPSVASYRDATGQPPANIPPTPNLFTAEITCDDATLTAIEADATYRVLWSEAL